LFVDYRTMDDNELSSSKESLNPFKRGAELLKEDPDWQPPKAKEYGHGGRPLKMPRKYKEAGKAREAAERAAAAPQVVPQTLPLSDVRPTTTRSDELGVALIEKGIDAGRISGELEKALQAETATTKWEQIGGKWTRLDVMIPDWKTRLTAIKQIVLIRGWEFQVEKMVEGTISRDVLMVVRNLNIGGKTLSEASIEDLEREHRRNIEAGLIEDAEVAEDTSPPK